MTNPYSVSLVGGGDFWGKFGEWVGWEGGGRNIKRMNKDGDERKVMARGGFIVYSLGLKYQENSVYNTQI